MFRFEHAEHLYAFIGLLILIVVFMASWYARQRAIRQFGNSSLIGKLMPQVSKYKHTVKFILMLLAFTFLIIGWANPQWGSKREKVKRKSADVFIAATQS